MKDGREDRFYIWTVCIHLADMLPTKLPRLVFGFQKICGWEGAIDGTQVQIWC